MADFRVILDSVDTANIDAILDEFLLQFPLERSNAEQILRQAPIVLLDQLNAEEANNVRTNLVKLTRLGAKIRVTTAAAGTVKRLTWPVIPAAARRAGNVFICPHCGERFTVHPWKAGEPETVPPQGEAARPQAEAAKPPKVAPPEPAQEVPVVAPVTPPPAAPPKVEPAADAAEPPTPVKPLTPPVAPPSNEPLGIAPKDEEVPILETKLQAAAGARAATPGAKAAPSKPVGGPPQGGGGFRVSVRQRLTGKSRKRAAELVAKYQDISRVKAARVVERSLFTVLKDVTEKEAEACRREFKEAGISVRVMEAK